MRLRPFIIILPFFWWGFDARAQAPEQIPVPEQWQLSLDVIKSKAQAKLIENKGLQAEYRNLLGQAQKLQQLIGDQQYKNEQMNLFLKGRHGGTDQQVRIKELTRSIKTKTHEARTYQNTLPPPSDDGLNLLHKQLEDESKQEVLLEKVLRALKIGYKK